ncbi:MAG: CvpA family protein [Firmicutes bacterium]|nr:CvpA family protein [Bacillota bacterium]
MNVLDWILVIVLIFALIRGWRDGFVGGWIGLFSWLAGLAVAYFLSGPLATWLWPFLERQAGMNETPWARLGLLIVLVLILLAIARRLLLRLGNGLEKLFRLPILGLVNRFAGALFHGAITAAFLILILVICVSTLGESPTWFGSWLRESTLAHTAVAVFDDAWQATGIRLPSRVHPLSPTAPPTPPVY